MNILEIQVDGFGIWSNLKLQGLEPGLNVFYGPNEAGKTTIMQFIRTVFYGFSPERRARYLPPVAGGQGGGNLRVSGSQGAFLIRRVDDPALGDPTYGRLMITDADGGLAPPDRLPLLLGRVDEPIFNHVFALGLRELQELGTLSDSAAAELLFDITAGQDRVSLLSVIRDLQANRNRLIAADGKGGKLPELLARGEKLKREIGELRHQSARYVELANQQTQRREELNDCETQSAELQKLVHRLEVAISLSERWRSREQLDDRLSRLGNVSAIPPKILKRLESLQLRARQGEERIKVMQQERGQLLANARQLRPTWQLAKFVPRIESMVEQDAWAESLESQIERLRVEVQAVGDQISSEQSRLSSQFKSGGNLNHASVDHRRLKALRPLARDLVRAQSRQEQVSRRATAAKSYLDSRSKEITRLLGDREEVDLHQAIEKTGDLVAQLRRRLQLEDRLEQMRLHHGELQTQIRELMEDQLLPARWVAVLGAFFVFGVALVLVGVFFPKSLVGSAGGWMAGLGLFGLIVAVISHLILERSKDAQLETCQRQAAALNAQLEQIKSERAEIDAELPQGGGPIAARLQRAERDLTGLQELAGSELQQDTVLSRTQSASTNVERAEAILQQARKRWESALSNSRLPNSLSPEDVRRLTGSSARLKQLRRRQEWRSEEQQQRLQERQSFEGRVDQLLSEIGVTRTFENVTQKLAHLRSLLTEIEQAKSKLHKFKEHRGHLRTQYGKQMRGIRAAVVERKRILVRCGVQDEDGLKRRQELVDQAELLRRDRQSISRDIVSLLGSRCSEDELKEVLDRSSRGELEAQLADASRRLAECSDRRQNLAQQVGRIDQELLTLSEDRRLAERLLEADMLEMQIAEWVRQWQSRATMEMALDSLRSQYEANRQPETLLDATNYLNKMTGGDYTRIWTPLGQHVLLVDDAAGTPLPVESLSQGTREQVFLSLRLALVEWYAKRGVALPLILDDVLVNFDSQRARYAATVLRDFAATGKQMLLFTCHEHIWRLFKSLKVNARQLPRRKGEELPEEPVIAIAPPPPKKVRPIKVREPLEEEAIPVAVEIPRPAPPPPPPMAIPAPPPVPVIAETIVARRSVRVIHHQNGKRHVPPAPQLVVPPVPQLVVPPVERKPIPPPDPPKKVETYEPRVRLPVIWHQHPLFADANWQEDVTKDDSDLAWNDRFEDFQQNVGGGRIHSGNGHTIPA